MRIVSTLPWNLFRFFLQEEVGKLLLFLLLFFHYFFWRSIIVFVCGGGPTNLFGKAGSKFRFVDAVKFVLLLFLGQSFLYLRGSKNVLGRGLLFFFGIGFKNNFLFGGHFFPVQNFILERIPKKMYCGSNISFICIYVYIFFSFFVTFFCALNFLFVALKKILEKKDKKIRGVGSKKTKKKKSWRGSIKPFSWGF